MPLFLFKINLKNTLEFQLANASFYWEDMVPHFINLMNRFAIIILQKFPGGTIIFNVLL